MRVTAVRRTVCPSLLLVLSTLVACGDAVNQVTAPSRAVNLASPNSQLGAAPVTVFVTNVDQLYEAVNTATTSSVSVVLAAGTYVLAPTDGAGLPRSNGGRLELRENMSLHGVVGDRSAVVIDARGLSVIALTGSLGRTGPVRVGRGNNTIEWLTILGNAAAAAGIETDLAGTVSTEIRIVNVVSTGSMRGIDVRNLGPTMAGRRILVEIVGSEFSATPQAQPSQGIRLGNLNGADGAVIVASLRGNRAHDSQFGCLIVNLASSNAVIQVQSFGDHFFGNAEGCSIIGGIVTGTTGMANSNSITFEAHGSAFVDNTQPSSLDRGGILVIGGESPNQANATSQNTVTVRLRGSTVARNQYPDLAAFGARTMASSGVAGSGNRVQLELGGVSKQIEPVAIPSIPEEPSGTNTVSVVR